MNDDRDVTTELGEYDGGDSDDDAWGDLVVAAVDHLGGDYDDRLVGSEGSEAIDCCSCRCIGSGWLATGSAVVGGGMAGESWRLVGCCSCR